MISAGFFARFCRSFQVFLVIKVSTWLCWVLSVMSRSTRNSRDAMSPLPTTTASSAGSSTGSSAAPTTMPIPPALVQQIVDAVKASLAAEKAVDQPPAPSSSGELPFVAAAVPAVGGVPEDLSSCSAMLLASGGVLSSIPSIPSSAQSTGTQSLVVPSFVNTFSAPVPSILPSSSAPPAVGPSLSTSPFSASSTFIVPSEQLSTNTVTTPLPVLHQPFVVGPGFSPVPAKTVSQIASGKFVELSDLLQANIAQSESEPQLFFDGQMILTSNPKRSRKKIDDIVSWIEAFSIFVMILTSFFPHRWKDLSQYKLLILRTYQQFRGRVWLNYNRAFQEHAAASRVTDWSAMDVQLYNFHAAGVAARGRPGESAILPEPVGDRTATIKCRSWNKGRCIAPSGSCRFAHVCSDCTGDHRASECPGHPAKEVSTAPKHHASSPLVDGRSRSKSHRT